MTTPDGRPRIGRDDAAPFVFTGTWRRVTVDMDHDQDIDHDAAGRAQTARE